MRNTKPGEACPSCNWKYGPHICADLTKKVPGEAIRKDDGKPVRSRGPMSQDQKDRISESLRRRWANLNNQMINNV